MMRFSVARAGAIFAKEFKHILRDPFTLVMALLLPVAIVLILGNSIEFNIRSIPMAGVDMDRTAASRQLMDTFGASNYFIPRDLANPGDAFDEILRERVRAVLVIPPHFERDMHRAHGDVQIMLDGADNSSMIAMTNYLRTINQNAWFKINDMPRAMVTDPLNIKTRYMFNPELNSRWFSVPGLAAVIIALVAIMLTTLTVCREWERGSMEMLLSTPATTLEIILGKVVPYAILSLIGFVLVFVMGRLVFGVPFVGGYVTLIVGTMLFILGYLAIGLLISVSTHKQDVAIQFACIVGLLPAVVLSGFIFPVEYMGRAYRVASSVFPARFYIDLCRDQFLKGSPIGPMMPKLAAMAVVAMVLIIVCLVRFKRTLE
ncbi:ABC transporter permease [bacterium]|nr:ABC transporter permease [bacterium]